MKVKYVIFDGLYPVIFSEAHKHSDFQHVGPGKPTSAGFCSIHEVDAKPEHDTCCTRWLEVQCYGESISLRLKSNPENDQRWLERMLNS
jgi:hypothetical protein